MQRFTDQVAIVTGAATGIGRATARQFAREGANIVIADVNDEGATETLRLIEGDGGVATYQHTDVSKSSDVQALVDQAIDRYGRIDILHANAGIELVKTLADTSEAEWDHVIGINMKGVYLSVHAVLQHMRPRRKGAIVITASPHALATYKEMAAYAASKGGALALMRATALDVAQEGIRVNAILPGAVDTPMVRREAQAYSDPEEAMREFAGLQPMGRMGQPEEIAPAVCFLASDEARFITGAYLAVDGGGLARL